MEQLISKITSLSYELFGIFLPGIIQIFIFIWIFWCIGDFAPIITFGYIEPVVFSKYSDGLKLPMIEIRFGLLVFFAFGSYFIGHLIFWLSRLGSSKELVYKVDNTKQSLYIRFGAKIYRALILATPKFLQFLIKKSFFIHVGITIHRVVKCLLFSIPKSSIHYYPHLEGLKNEGTIFLELPIEMRTWGEFFPVAKSRLMKDLPSSLVTTYQNKYTLHRSLTTIAIFSFWLIISLILLACVKNNGATTFRMFPMIVSAIGCVFVIGGFSASYIYNWKMFGNTIITEIFMLSKTKPTTADLTKQNIVDADKVSVK